MTPPMTADDEISIDGLLRTTRKRIDGGAAHHGEPWVQGGRAAVNFIEQRAARVMRREMAAVYAERDALQRRVAELEDSMTQIERRTFAHPDDDDGDHRRNLYIANSHAREALARSKGGAS